MSEYVPTVILPEYLGRWELEIDVPISTATDEHGNHAVTGNGIPRRGNDFLFNIVAKAADAFAQTGHLLHWTEFFQGDPKAVKAKGKKQQAQSFRGSGNPSDT